MKISTVIMIAVFGVVMVAADESLEGRLRNALKALLEDQLESENLEMEARVDSAARCETDTDYCDGHGTCRQSTFSRNTEKYICSCDEGYRVNTKGGCSAASAREIEYFSNFAREVELEMLTRDTLARCNFDTSYCDGFGQCVQSELQQSKFICKCEANYRNNAYGGCSPRTEREIEYLTMIARDQELALQGRDTLAHCNRDTKECDDAGECVQSTIGRSRGNFICRCNEGYKNNLYGGCSLTVAEDEINEQTKYADQEERTMDLVRRLAQLYQE
uniref:EGIP n=1 Tax=Paracentrotus lividus TaxID=7656 RepID=E9L089_PARLI|nr:EGIP precursor [Paracentrotus lividus]